jgi:hypothetical protein
VPQDRTSASCSAVVDPFELSALMQHFPPRESKYLVVPTLTITKPQILERDSTNLNIDLKPLECEWITVFPILSSPDVEAVPMGFRGPLNGAGAVVASTFQEAKSLALTIRGCGCFRLAIRSKRPVQSIAVKEVAGQTMIPCESVPSTGQCAGILQLGFNLFEFELLERAEPGNRLVSISFTLHCGKDVSGSR